MATVIDIRGRGRLPNVVVGRGDPETGDAQLKFTAAGIGQVVIQMSYPVGLRELRCAMEELDSRMGRERISLWVAHLCSVKPGEDRHLLPLRSFWDRWCVVRRTSHPTTGAFEATLGQYFTTPEVRTWVALHVSMEGRAILEPRCAPQCPVQGCVSLPWDM